MIKSILLTLFFIVMHILCIKPLQAQNVEYLKSTQHLETLVEMGIEYYYTDLDSSTYYFQRAVSLMRIKKYYGEAWIEALTGLTAIHDISRNWDSARYYSDQALLSYNPSLHSYETYVTVINNKASMAYRTGDLFGAIEDFILLIDTENFWIENDDIEISTLLHNYASLLQRVGEFDLAEKYYLRVELILEKHVDEKETFRKFVETYNALGYLYKIKNDLLLAMNYYRKSNISSKYLKESSKRSRLARESSISLALIFSELNESDSVKFYLKEYNKYPKQDSSDNMTPWVLGFVALKNQNSLKAKKHFLKDIFYAKIRFADRPNHPNLTIRYQKLAQAYSLCTQFDSAMYYYQHALRFSAEIDTNQSYFELPTIKQVRYPHNVIPVLIERGKTLKAWYKVEGDLQRLKDAYQSYLLATQLIDRLRKGFRSAGSKLLLSEDAIPTYEAAIQLAWQLYETTSEEQYREQIVSLMEQNKASLLLERLKEGDIKTQLGVPDSVLEKERELRIDIAYYQKLLYQKTEKDAEADSSKVSELRQKIFAREEALRQLQDLLSKDYPEYHKLKYAESVAGLNTIRSQLRQADDVMIEYFWGDSSLIVLGISQSELKYHSVPISELEPKLLAFRDMLSNRQAVQQNGNSAESVIAYQKVAFALYQQLIEPVVPRRDNPQNLIIIPDGPLALLPFDLLVVTQSDEEPDFRMMDYLLKSYDSHYAYSATLLLDQVVSIEAEQYYAGFAPAYGDTDLYAEARDFSPLDSGVRGGFSPLLYNQMEVEQIANQFSGSYWTGSEASEARFKTNAGKFRILHLAMHAFTNDDSPNLSGLVFSPSSPNASTEDGILHTYEIYDLDLKADLAVLSACNTGIGKIQKGEGVMSLARAFTYAGCPSLLMSLWQADDEATRDIMRLFFQKIDEGHSKSTALRLAKLEFLTQTDRPHPHYWGAFVVIGNNDPLQGRKVWPWLLGLGAIVLGGILAYPRFKRVA